MRGHFLSGTRKLNRHYQSGSKRQLVYTGQITGQYADHLLFQLHWRTNRGKFSIEIDGADFTWSSPQANVRLVTTGTNISFMIPANQTTPYDLESSVDAGKITVTTQTSNKLEFTSYVGVTTLFEGLIYFDKIADVVNVTIRWEG